MKVAVLSDIHGNYYALEAVLKMVVKEKISKLLILGDFVGYYYYPDKVLRLLANWDYTFIRGNHEVLLYQLTKQEISEPELCFKYGSGHRMAMEKLTEKEMKKLLTAPDKHEVILNGINILMCHGSPWDMNQYIYPDSHTELLEKCAFSNFDFVLIGHSHYPFVYQTKTSTLINVGSVGQSRYMGGVANWTVINTENKCIEMKSTDYDVRSLLKEIEQTDPHMNYMKEILMRNT